MAGFLLRPGLGVVRDDLRIDALWRVHEGGACFPGRRIKSQEYILWRRVAGGLTRERQVGSYRRDRQDPQRQGGRRTRAPGWIIWN